MRFDVSRHGEREAAELVVLDPKDQDTAARMRQLWSAVIPPAGVDSLVDRVHEDSQVAVNRVVGVLVADALVGMVTIVPGPGSLVLHRVEISRLLVAPEFRHNGIGGRLLVAARDYAEELGRRLMVALAVSGTGLPEFLLGRGWTPVGRRTGTVDLGDGGYRDELMFQSAV